MAILTEQVKFPCRMYNFKALVIGFVSLSWHAEILNKCGNFIYAAFVLELGLVFISLAAQVSDGIQMLFYP